MNWKKLVEDLIAKKWSQSAIAREIGCDHSRINRVINNDEGLGFETGTALAALHAKECKPKRKTPA